MNNQPNAPTMLCPKCFCIRPEAVPPGGATGMPCCCGGGRVNEAAENPALVTRLETLKAAHGEVIRERDEALAKLAEAEAQRDVQTSECRTAHNLYETVRDERDRLAAQLAEARWILCSERMPEPGTVVLTFIPGMRDACGGVETRVYDPAKYGSTYGHWCDWLPPPTHWRPLPAPPSDRGAEGDRS